MEDLTGTPPSEEDIHEAEIACRKALVLHIAALPPQLATQLPNILRCLDDYKKLRKKGL